MATNIYNNNMMNPPENFIPFSTTRCDKDFDTIEVNLKGFGFSEGHLKLEVENGILTISGKRILDNNKFSQFSQSFKLAENHSDTNQFHVKFSGEILYVGVPKKNPLVVTQAISKKNININQNTALNLGLGVAVVVALMASIFKTIRDGGNGHGGSNSGGSSSGNSCSMKY